MANNKQRATTQNFTEISSIEEDVLFFKNGHACLIIEIRAVNFALMSKTEQEAKIYSYSTLLNSLSFPIQIYIRSKKIDISSYLKILEGEIKSTPNQLLAQNISLYKKFVEELVKVNTVLDKQFYLVIPYSPLEAVSINVTKGRNPLQMAKNTLHSKATSLLSQLAQLSLPAIILQADQLAKLYYEIYNEGSIEPEEVVKDTKSAVVSSRSILNK